MEALAFFVLCCLILLVGGGKPAEHDENTSTVSVTTHKPANNKTTGEMDLNSLKSDSSMIQRALYVLIGITIIGVLYFLVRAVRLKKSSTPRKKYGLLANYDDTVEMAQLESDDDDNTVYEARSLRR